eukprot:12105005-Prorocentrum_lima.AAC.1
MSVLPLVALFGHSQLELPHMQCLVWSSVPTIAKSPLLSVLSSALLGTVECLCLLVGSVPLP